MPPQLLVLSPPTPPSLVLPAANLATRQRPAPARLGGGGAEEERLRRRPPEKILFLEEGSRRGRRTMGLLGMVGDSFGCSATGERLVSAARDGDIQEAMALLELNPRLARYSTFGIRNSPLHYSAAKGHHEIVSLLIESGVDINLRNCRGQTALMQACLYGHWKVVQILVLFKANIHKKDCFSGATAIHFAALKGHTRCLRLLVADYVPSLSEFWSVMHAKSADETNKEAFDAVGLRRLINGKSDGGVTPLHLAALHGHAESVQLLLDLGASVSEVTINDGSTIDLIGSGSTPLHYAACGGSAVCCQLLVAAGANMRAQNTNGLTPLMVARSWHKNSVEGILTKRPEVPVRILPSSYLSLPMMSIFKIARECGWRKTSVSSTCHDQCAICLEMECTVSAEGCGHEFCTKCALYLCATASSSTSIRGVPGSIPCPLCRHTIVSFVRLASTTPIKELPWTNKSLALCAAGASTGSKHADPAAITSSKYTGSLHRRSELRSLRSSSVDLGCSSFRTASSGKLSSIKLNCTGADETMPCLVNCFRPDVQRSSSYRERIRRYSQFS
uniref:RING-type E3 ubiquitin transferase n=1 Tax=Leersia perrieri TaxID=77586 RepID=A0A0D9X5Y2_9ORYZ